MGTRAAELPWQILRSESFEAVRELWASLTLVRELPDEERKRLHVPGNS